MISRLRRTKGSVLGAELRALGNANDDECYGAHCTGRVLPPLTAWGPNINIIRHPLFGQCSPLAAQRRQHGGTRTVPPGVCTAGPFGKNFAFFPPLCAPALLGNASSVSVSVSVSLSLCLYLYLCLPLSPSPSMCTITLAGHRSATLPLLAAA